MRILLVTNTYPPADITGVGALAHELKAALRGDGHDAEVLTRTIPPGEAGVVATGGSKLIFPLLAAWSYVTGPSTYDLVHVHESDGTFITVATRLARLLGLEIGDAKVVATLQVSYRRERLSVRDILADGRVVSSPTRSEYVFAYLKAPIHSILGRVTSWLADAVVAPSRVTATELEEDYGARVAAVVPNGLATPAEAPTPDGDLSHPVILYAGRLRTRKAVAVLIEAFVTVLAKAPEATLVLAGDGEQRGALEAQVGRLGIAERVRFEGVVPRERMEQFYRSADIFCMPSLYEGFPVAILEAMAHGLPVVSTRVAGIPEAIEEGQTGYVVAAESADELAEALLRLVTNSGLRDRQSVAARERFDRLYRIDRVVDAYLEVYRAVIGAPE